MGPSVRLVLLSDTHGHHQKLRVPDGDVLVHAGDFCTSGKESQARNFVSWLRTMPHPNKVIVAGNHDRCMEDDISLGKRMFYQAGEHYLLDEARMIVGLTFYGSPWQPEFCNWAFNIPRHGPFMQAVCERIPDDLDVLVTHGPSYGVGDHCSGGNVGCEVLSATMKTRPPRLHVFGHIHEGYGAYERDGRLSVNASICTGNYAPRNPIQVVDVPLDKTQPIKWVSP